MEIRRVEVRNVRSYEHARLDLGTGTTLLVGDVGSGKTSLLYAVEMALFGAAEVDATYLVRHGATEASVLVTLDDDGHLYEIERVFRRVRRRGREAFEPGKLTYRVDGASTQYSSTELRQRVIERLGFRDNPNPRAHSDLWRWAVHVPQEQMREILAADPSERLATVRRALGVERFHVAAENAKEVARDLRQTAAAVRAQGQTLREYADDLPEATVEARRLEGEHRLAADRLEVLAPSLSGARARAEEAQRTLESFTAERARLADLAEEAERDRKRTGEIVTRRAKIRTEIDASRTELDALASVAEPLAGREAEAARTEVGLAEARSHLEHLAVAEANWAGAVALRATRAGELARCEADRARTESEIGALLAERDALDEGGESGAPTPTEPETLEALDAALRRSREEERSAGDHLALARREAEELRSLLSAGVCPRCHQTVRSEEFRHHATETEEAARDGERRLQEAEAARRTLEERRHAIEEQQRLRVAWEAREAQRRTLGAALAQRQELLALLELRRAEAVDALETAAHQSDSLAVPVDETAKGKARLRSAEAASRSAQVELEKARRAVERRALLTDRLRLTEGEEARLGSEEGELAVRRVGRERTIEEVRGRLAHEEELRGEASRLLGVLTQAEREHRAQLEATVRLAERAQEAGRRERRAETAAAERDRLVGNAETVESKATWLTGAFHDAVLTMEKRVLERAQADFEGTFRSYFAALMDDTDLVAVTDATFSPSAEIRGVETPAEALSGGERTSLALAYRLALSRVVRSLGHLRLDTLLLDEPTDGFSPEQVQSMGELLERLHLPQVVLVSHERELEAVADRVVVVEKIDGVSRLRDSRTEGGSDDGGEAPAARPSSSPTT